MQVFQPLADSQEYACFWKR